MISPSLGRASSGAAQNAVAFGVAVTTLTAVCICVGAAAAGLAPSFPVWELAMVGSAIFGVLMWRVLGATHPLSWMCTLYSFYFLLGAQTWAEPSARLGFRNFVATEPTLRLAFIGLVSFSVGATVIGGLRPPASRVVADRLMPSAASDTARKGGVLLAAVGVLGLLMSVRNGLPILQPAIRSEANHGPWAYCAYALVPAGLLLTLTPRSARRDALLVGWCSILLIVMAYRSPVILLIGTFLLLRRMQGQIRQQTVVLGALGLVAFAAIVFSYRASAVVQGGYFVPSGVLRQFPILFPLYSGFAREGVAVFARLHELIPSAHAYMHGALQLSMFHIHGGSASPRQTVYTVINGTGFARTTYTPTILGGPYMDYGAWGVVAELFIAGCISGALYRAAAGRLTAWRALWFSYCAVLMVMAIHTGLLDDETLVIVPAMTALSFAAVRTLGSNARPRRAPSTGHAAYGGVSIMRR